MSIQVRPGGLLIWQGKTYECALGKSGITSAKQEGDGATPVGFYPLREVFYRPVRLAQPATDLPLTQLNPADHWCDDPDHADYNQKVVHPHRGRVEELWRQDAVYDVIVVIGYNDKPALKGKGSAIFMHIAKQANNGKLEPTEGCVALRRDDLLEILEGLTPKCQIEIFDS